MVYNLSLAKIASQFFISNWRNNPNNREALQLGSSLGQTEENGLHDSHGFRPPHSAQFPDGGVSCWISPSYLNPPLHSVQLWSPVHVLQFSLHFSQMFFSVEKQGSTGICQSTAFHKEWRCSSVDSCALSCLWAHLEGCIEKFRQLMA